MKPTYILLFFSLWSILKIQSMVSDGAMQPPDRMPIAAMLVIKQLNHPDPDIPIPDLVVFHGAPGTGKSHLIDQFARAINAHSIQEDMDLIIADYKQSEDRMSASKYIENRFFALACDTSEQNHSRYTAIILDKFDHLDTLDNSDKFALANALFNLNALRNQNADHAIPPFLIIGEAKNPLTYGNNSVPIAVSHPSGEQVNELYAYFLAQKELSFDENFEEYFGQGSIDILQEHSIAAMKQCVEQYAHHVQQARITSEKDSTKKEKRPPRNQRMTQYLNRLNKKKA